MWLFTKAILIATLIIFHSSGYASSNKLTVDLVNKAINYCISVVRKTPIQEAFYRQFFEEFDAFYNPATERVQNNATRVGDKQPLFFFNKCMVEQGFPLS